MGRQNRLIGLLGAVTPNLATDRRGGYANLLRYACLTFPGTQSGFYLVTLALSQLPVMRSHLRLNPLV